MRTKIRLAAHVYLNRLPSSYVALNLVSPTPMATPVMDRTQLVIQSQLSPVTFQVFARQQLICLVRSNMTSALEPSSSVSWNAIIHTLIILTLPTAHARVVYGPGYPAGSIFDVVNSPGVINSTSTVSHVIVYPTTKLFSANGVVSGKCVEVMRSTEFLYIRQTYWGLMNLLRPKILKAICM